MDHSTKTQGLSLPWVRVTRKELAAVALMAVWVGAVVYGNTISRGLGARLHGHRTAFWLAPLLLGVWCSGRKTTSILGGALSGVAVGMFVSTRNPMIPFVACTACASFASFARVPSVNWKGVLKAAYIGLVCGWLALATRGVLQFGSGRMWLGAEWKVALVIYALSGAVGSVSAWLAFVLQDRIRNQAKSGKRQTLIQNIRRVLSRGFTLIELLIVVAIIGILAAIAIPNFLNAQTRAKVSRTEADFHALATGLEAYRVDNSGYPTQGSGGGSGSADRLNVLSTPVSYLKSPQLVDPFCIEKTADVFYKYSNFKEAPEALGDPYSLSWGVRGRAPDTVFSRTRDVLTSAMINSSALYDPTNGITSAGDILRTGSRGLAR